MNYKIHLIYRALTISLIEKVMELPVLVDAGYWFMLPPKCIRSSFPKAVTSCLILGSNVLLSHGILLFILAMTAEQGRIGASWGILM